jgi:mannose-6-phosphate isomerase-like protein (cupin superfamily)
MEADIKHLQLDAEFYTPEGCYITELSNTPDDPGLSIARARVALGVTTRWHRLRGTSERYYILQGKGLMVAGDLPHQEVTAGDVVRIAPHYRQRITNTGSSDLIFLAICTLQTKAALDLEALFILICIYFDNHNTY